MIIAITGATGFIGKRLVNHHLALGDEVRILTRKRNLKQLPGVAIYIGSLLDDKITLKEFSNGVDILYHCAAEIKNADLMYQVNVLGTTNLLEAAKGGIKHWVQLSSTGVYGPVFNGVVDEQRIPKPNNVYETSKLEADRLVVEAGEKKWFTYSIVRPSNVFGPDMSNQSLFQLIKAVDNGRYFYIGKAGSNANYVSVENVVEVLYLAATKKVAIGNIYNISDHLKLEEFIGAIAKFLNKPEPSLRLPLFIMKFFGFFGDFIPKSPITSSRVRALTNKVVYSNQFVVQNLGFKSKVGILDALSELVEAYKKNKL